MSTRRPVEVEKWTPGGCSYPGGALQTTANRRFDAAGFTIKANIKVTMSAARQAIKRDVGNPITAEFELDEIKVIWSIRLRHFWHARTNRERLLTKKISAEVENVRAKILPRAAVLLRTPTSLSFRGHKKCLIDINKQQFAEVGGADSFLGRLMNAHESELVIDNDVSTNLVRKSNNRICVIKTVHKRLFAKDMAACFEPKPYQREMGIGWCCYCEEIWLGLFQHFRD